MFITYVQASAGWWLPRRGNVALPLLIHTLATRKGLLLRALLMGRGLSIFANAAAV